MYDDNMGTIREWIADAGLAVRTDFEKVRDWPLGDSLHFAASVKDTRPVNGTNIVSRVFPDVGQALVVKLSEGFWPLVVYLGLSRRRLGGVRGPRTRMAISPRTLHPMPRVPENPRSGSPTLVPLNMF